MRLEEAERIAGNLKAFLAPACERLEIAGSIRRRRPEVGDIDLVLIPKDWLAVRDMLKRLGKVKISGRKITRVIMDGGTQVDTYYATPGNFATLLLIRTGSAENNIRLCTLARKRGWHLAASGEGLFNEHGERIAGDSEESIYQALGLRYQEPWERNGYGAGDVTGPT